MLALAGGVVGLAGALGYAWLMMAGLRTWWVDAVGTTALRLHVSAGVAGRRRARRRGRGASLCIWWTLRGLARVTERSLLAGDLAVAAAGGRWTDAGGAHGSWPLVFAVPGAGAAGRRHFRRGSIRPAAFFGAGALLLGRGAVARGLSGPAPAASRGGRARLGPASAAWALRNVSVSAGPQRAVGGRGGGGGLHPRHRGCVPPRRRPRRQPTAASGTGGYSVMVESLVPLVHDPDTDEGRAGARSDAPRRRARFEPFRVLPGDDASCLNLYEPTQPRILGAARQLPARGPLRVSGHRGRQRRPSGANPWLLLERRFDDGAVP